MKQIIIAVLLLSSITALSQSSSFGIKGGLNYGSTGDISSVSDFTGDFQLDGENKVGYHLGLFGKIEFAGLFIQPEIIYTKLTTEYDFTGTNGINRADYDFSKIDIPLLLGINILGPLHIKGGPSFQYILNNEFDDIDITLQDPEDSFTVGYQVGAGIIIGRLGVDVRYEGAFSDNTVVSQSQVEGNNFGVQVDNRPSQWILSFSYALDKRD